mgnify:CR=1 FL=1
MVLSVTVLPPRFAGVGTGDDERIKIAAQPYRDRDDRLAGDERMAGPDEVQLAVGPHLRADGPHGERQPRPGKNALKLEQHIVVELDLLAVVG